MPCETILPRLRARGAGASPRLARARPLQPAARPLRDQRALLADPHRRPDDPARHLRRQSQGPALVAPLPPAQHAVTSSACARPAPRPRISTWCSARTCTPTTSAGTPCCATAAGCRPSRTPNICSREPTTPIGTSGKTRRWPAIRVTWPMTTASCRSCSPARRCWSTTATTSPARALRRSGARPFAGPCPVQARRCGTARGVLRRRHPPRPAGLRAALDHMADEWPRKAAVSRRRMLESCAEHDALLFPIHFGAPHVARIGHALKVSRPSLRLEELSAAARQGGDDGSACTPQVKTRVRALLGASTMSIALSSDRRSPDIYRADASRAGYPRIRSG